MAENPEGTRLDLNLGQRSRIYAPGDAGMALYRQSGVPSFQHLGLDRCYLMVVLSRQSQTGYYCFPMFVVRNWFVCDLLLLSHFLSSLILVYLMKIEKQSGTLMVKVYF